ncbi:MAG: zinc-dependent dehydrogenase [Desulfatibacillaceae bacterium]
MMRVATYYRNDDVRLEKRPVPPIGQGELLVRVMACGICGSDVMEWYRIKKAPLVLGHEISGEVVETQGEVNGVRPGDRVFVSHHVPCGNCRYCLTGRETVCDTLRSTNFDPGGFSEYLRVPAINVEKKGVFVLPETISDDEGTFVEPLACAHRAQRLAGLSPGQSVLVLGAGISGLLHIALARAMGAGLIMATDISDYRLEKAREAGAHVVMNARDDVAEKVREANNGTGADLVIVCAGAPSAFDQAFECVDRGGTVALFAPTEPGVKVDLPVWNVWKDGVAVVSSYGAAPVDIRCAIDLLAWGRVPVQSMITHRLALADAASGFGLVAGANESVKVIIRPQE